MVKSRMFIVLFCNFFYLKICEHFQQKGLNCFQNKMLWKTSHLIYCWSFKSSLFTCFWLVLGHCCYVVLSSCSCSGGCSLAVMQASHCGMLSLLWITGSGTDLVVVAHRF